MTTSALRRQVKNIVHNYSEAEIKVREATSNDPWGPPSSLMSEIADLTFNTVAFAEVMGMIWRRLNDSGKNWRHVYKALTLLDYLIKTGSEKVTHQCRENLYTIQTLKDFQYVDRDGQAEISPNFLCWQKPLPPISSTDEERQLQLALALSKEEHEKEVRAWQGENSLLQRALEETAPGREEEEEEDKMKKSQSSILELADIFGPAPVPPSHTSADPWDMPDLKPKAEPAASAWAGAADPWVPLPATAGDPLSQATASSHQTSAGPWDFPPGASSSSSSSDPWGKTPLSSSFSSADPWVKASPPAQVASGATSAADPWATVTEQPPNPGKRGLMGASGLLGTAHGFDHCSPSLGSCSSTSLPCVSPMACFADPPPRSPILQQDLSAGSLAR
nr:PREDICTED: epsin-3-like [Struthio camelus australis]